MTLFIFGRAYGNALFAVFVHAQVIGVALGVALEHHAASAIGAFMITGPATKITNLGALKIVLGAKRFVLYLAYVILISLVIGLAVDRIL